MHEVLASLGGTAMLCDVRLGFVEEHVAGLKHYIDQENIDG